MNKMRVVFYWESVWHSLPKFLLFLLANIVSGEGNVQAATENWSTGRDKKLSILGEVQLFEGDRSLLSVAGGLLHYLFEPRKKH